jgi:hypothetical protein
MEIHSEDSASSGSPIAQSIIPIAVIPDDKSTTLAKSQKLHKKYQVTSTRRTRCYQKSDHSRPMSSYRETFIVKVVKYGINAL